MYPNNSFGNLNVFLCVGALSVCGCAAREILIFCSIP